MRNGRRIQNGKGSRNGNGSNFLLALIGFLFIFSFSVVVTLNFRQIYYYEIEAQHLTEEVPLTEEQLRENYDALIDYNLFWKGVDRLEFPDFPMSEQGRIHFEEVKRIFVWIQYLMLGSGILFAAGLFGKIRKRDFGSLKLTAILTLAIPTVLGLAVAVNWERFFITFHHLMFRNDYWLFDPATDPVILVLPDAFFLHCAGVILGCIVLGSVISWMGYRLGMKKKSYSA